MHLLILVINDIGGCLIFLKDVSLIALKGKWHFSLICEQIWKVTKQSFSTTGLAGFFVGAIMTVQFTMQVKEFGALGYLGGLSTSATIRRGRPSSYCLHVKRKDWCLYLSGTWNDEGD